MDINEYLREDLSSLNSYEVKKRKKWCTADIVGVDFLLTIDYILEFSLLAHVDGPHGPQCNGMDILSKAQLYWNINKNRIRINLIIFS